MPGYLDQYEGLLTNNPIWLKRTVGNGVISAEDAIDIGITGPALRGSGVDWDLRRDIPYAGYENYQFKVPVGENCDTFDRYKVRLIEMREACKIISQALDSLKPGPVLADCPQVCYPPKENVYNSIEGLIHHFKIASEGYPVPEGEVYQGVEAPKGELGYLHRQRRQLQAVPDEDPAALIRQSPGDREDGKGAMIADLVAVIGTLDIVLGEIDR